MEIVKSQAQLVIADLSSGEITLANALKKYGMSRDVFRKMLEKDFVLLGEYMAARRDAADARAEEILEIADKDPDPLRARNRIDARKWYASKLDPRVYGDRIDVNVVQRVDLTSALDEARKRALPGCDQELHQSTQVIETTAREVKNEAGQEPHAPKQNRKKADADTILS